MASKTDFDPVPSSLVVGKEISRGSYGVVYSAELDRKPVAVKRVHEALIDSRGGEHTLEKFKTECDQMKTLKHPHVVGFIGAYKDKKGPVLVMELMDESLERYLERNRERLSSERVLEICSSVCEGLAYLHGRYKPIIHRDVGSRNVLLTKGGVVKIADFGQAKLLKNKAEIIQTTQPGAIVYMPPEALAKKKEYSAKVDSFSLGVLLLEICTQHPPTSGWDGINAVIEVIRREDDLNMLDDAHPLKPIIIWCLQHEQLRPAVGVIRDHVARLHSVHNNAQRIATLEVELQIAKREIECGRVHVTELEAALKFANEEKELKSQQIHSLQRERDLLKKEFDEYKACQKVKESADDSRKKPAPDHFSSTMPSRGGSPYYIALQDLPLVKDEGQSNWTRIKEKAKQLANLTGPTHLLKGELIIVHDDGVGDYVRGRSATDDSKRIVCKKMCLSFLTDDEYQLLAPVKSPGERWALFNNQQALYAIKGLKSEDKTWVSLPVQQHLTSGLSGSTCHRATIRYIGEIQGEVGWYFEVRLDEPLGTSDGLFRNERYFICEDKHGIFLPASHLNASLKTQGKSATPAKGKVLLEVNKSASGQEFCENDKVVVFDKEGERITGKVKWAYPEVGRKYHIIGIETDNHLKHKIEGHVVGYSHLFNNRDYKKHTYLAMPETAVLKEDGTPVDGQDPLLQGFEVVHNSKSEDRKLSDSIISTASNIAQHENVPTKVIEDEQFRAIEEVEKQKLAKDFGVETHDLQEQKEALKELERQQEERDRDRKHQEANFGQDNLAGIPDAFTYDPPKDEYASDIRRKSDDYLLKGHDDTANKNPALINRQHSEGRSPQLNRRQQQAESHPLTVGSMVVVTVGDRDVHGTIRWMGNIPNVPNVIAGVELDEWHAGCGDGSWKNVEYFKCGRGHGMFIVLSKLRPDPRYAHTPQERNPLEKELDGKQMVLEEAVEAPRGMDLTKFIGERRGIQGHQNSCYLDSTLFAMYGFTSVFEELILQQPQDEFAANIVKIMSSEIIYPLRMNGMVSFDHVMKLRNILDKLNRIKGLTHAEQDPEEFLNLLFKHVLKLTDEDAFIHLKRPSGLDTEFFLQIFVEKSETTLFTMREILFKCMREQNISFAEAPGRLIIQLPRYGKEFKVYERIYPELHMDVSDICADYIPPKTICNICGAMPEFYCSDCGMKDMYPEGRLFLCAECTSTVHRHPDRQKHKPQSVDLKAASTRKVKLDLLSVVCIEKSHYVCFCRHGNRWFFFDSMADRTDDGFYIPCIQECQEIAEGLSDIEILRKKQPATLPPLLRRLVTNASICIYVDPVVEMY